MDSRAEAGLIARMLRREPEALQEFQTAYTPLLRYVIAPILQDPRDREECLADVVLRAWGSIESYDPGRAALTTWLTILARNAALNRRRDDAKRHSGEVPLDETIPDPGAGPEQAALRAEQAQALRQALKRLSSRDRDLFYRKYYYYQSTAQMAAELGLSERAVEGRLYRIRKHLQKELGGVWHD